VEILIADHQLAKACNMRTVAVRQYGQICGNRLLQRLAEMAAAANLNDLLLLPGARCHSLTGDRAGQFAVDLQHPRRLIFEPAESPVPRKPDGGVDGTKVRRIRILEVVDYHG